MNSKITNILIKGERKGRKEGIKLKIIFKTNFQKIHRLDKGHKPTNSRS
jgi:hypothetical protein